MSKQKTPRRTGPRWAQEFGSALAAGVHELEKTTSDRVAVIVSVASIDSVLDMLLRHFFIATSGSTQKECDWLLSFPPAGAPNPPLGSAGVRVRLAKCLGLIDANEASALLFAIKCRNKFAHEPIAPVLTAEDSQGLFDRLPREVKVLVSDSLCTLAKKKGDWSSPRWKFIVACMALHGLLFMRADIRFGKSVPGERVD